MRYTFKASPDLRVVILEAMLERIEEDIAEILECGDPSLSNSIQLACMGKLYVESEIAAAKSELAAEEEKS